VSAPSIAVTSGDIDIATGASVGVQGVTNYVNFNAYTNQPVYIGSGLQVPTGAYALNEDGDIHGKSVTVTSSSTDDGPSPDIIIGDVKIEGSQTSGGGVGNIFVDSYSGSIKVEGDVRFINAGASDSMTLVAGKNIEVNTDSGSLVMLDTSGEKLAGTLLLNAPNIWITDAAILTKLESDPNYSGRDTDLASNSGTSNPLGFVGAGEIFAEPTGTFFVENSGTATDMGGIAVGDGGLFIYNVNGGITPPAVAVDIYGRQLKSDGTSVTGNAFAGGVHTTGNFTQGSTINGCPVGSTTCSPPPPAR